VIYIVPKGYAQTITIYNLNDMNNTITRTLNSEFLKNVRMPRSMQNG
jgi:hypothetical protein